jgi:hypothetical protein
MFASLMKKINREVLVNKGVSILNAMKKSNKQMSEEALSRRNR